MVASINSLILRLIQPEDNLGRLSLGNAEYTPLKIFLKRAALSFHQQGIAKTYVLVAQGTYPVYVQGYITLMNSEIVLDSQQKAQAFDISTRYEVFPAVKIARLAVDKSLRGRGYGQAMMTWSVSLVLEKVVPHVGCRFLVVDAKRSSIAFYQKLGFELFRY